MSSEIFDPKLLGKEKKMKNKIKSLAFIKEKNRRSLKVSNYLQLESSGYLVPEENEQTLKFKQDQLKPLLPLKNAQNVFDLDLEFGSYNLDYSRNGKFLLLASSMGHISLLDWQKKDLITEFHVKEKIRDVKFLHEENMFATAQSKYVYIYDRSGLEIHKLKTHLEPQFLEYLPYHYLLVSASRLGFLKYHDISTGKIVSEYRCKFRDPKCMRQNNQNGIISIGDSNGAVSMYSPNTQNPLVKILCHKTGLSALSIDKSGNYLATLGSDSFLNIFDLRTYKKLYDYWTPSQSSCCDISQTGLLAVSSKNQLMVWKDWQLEKQKIPYIKQDSYKNKNISDMMFTPYEDFVGLGLVNGFSSMVIPGAGEANFDTFEVNVFENKKQKREAIIHSLLDKIPYDSITLNPNIIGNIDSASKEIIQFEKNKEEEERLRVENSKKKKRKHKMRGKNKPGKVENKKMIVEDKKDREKIKKYYIEKAKVKSAEKVKIGKEIDILNKIENDFIDSNFIKKKIKKD